MRIQFTYNFSLKVKVIGTVAFYDSPLPSKPDYIAIHDFSRDVDFVNHALR